MTRPYFNNHHTICNIHYCTRKGSVKPARRYCMGLPSRFLSIPPFLAPEITAKYPNSADPNIDDLSGWLAASDCTDTHSLAASDCTHTYSLAVRDCVRIPKSLAASDCTDNPLYGGKWLYGFSTLWRQMIVQLPTLWQQVIVLIPTLWQRAIVRIPIFWQQVIVDTHSLAASNLTNTNSPLASECTDNRVDSFTKYKTVQNRLLFRRVSIVSQNWKTYKNTKISVLSCFAKLQNNVLFLIFLFFRTHQLLPPNPPPLSLRSHTLTILTHQTHLSVTHTHQTHSPNTLTIYTHHKHSPHTITTHTHHTHSQHTLTAHTHQTHSPHTLTTNAHHKQSPHTLPTHTQLTHSPHTLITHTHQTHSPSTLTTHIHHTLTTH